MATKQLETISGPVEQINAKSTGIKLRAEWLNISAYHPIAVMPTPGDLVEAVIERTDRGPWINSLRIIGSASPSATAHDPSAEIRRLACLKAAATFCGHYSTVHEEVKSGDVLKIAEAFERWVLRGGEQPSA